MAAPFWDPPWEVRGQDAVVEDEDPADLAQREVAHRRDHRAPEPKHAKTLADNQR